MCQRNFCDYNKYYTDQAGGNLDISYYKGLPYQRGRGKFTSLARRYGVPVLKYLVKQGWELGKDLYSDIAYGKKLGPSLKSNLRKRASTAMKNLGEQIDQTGTGIRKRPKLIKRRRKRRTKTTKSKKTKRRGRKKRRTKRKTRKSKSKFDIFKNVI